MKACLLRPGSPPLGSSLNDAEQRNPQGRAQERRAPVIADVEAVGKLISRNRPCALTKIDLSESSTTDHRNHGKGWRTPENTFIQPLK
jgi:hypothetical protein